jgi:5-methylthioadenosine/S-adenosylhomocysteine deaminase
MNPLRLRAVAAALLAAAFLPVAAQTPKAPAAPPAPAVKNRCDLIVVAGAVLTMDPGFRILGETAIVIKDGVLVEMSTPAEIDSKWTAAERVERKGSVVMPGLVNTHTHAAMTLMRGIADDKPLMEWLHKYIFPAEAKNVTPEFVRDGTLLACMEMVRGGTTTFADMYYYEGQAAEAVQACGMRAVLGETWIDGPAPGHATLAEEQKVTREFITKWRGSRRVTPAVAPHSAYSCSKETLVAAKALSDEFSVPLLIHVSETQDEQKQVQAKYGMTPVRWLDQIGFLGPRVVAAHGVWLDAADLQLMAAKKVALSHNPESNMKLGSGVAPVVAARKAGVVTGLATDGVAGSNNDLDMFESMDFAGKLAKVTALDPTVLPARDLLRMATIDGAKVLDLDRVTGSLELGKTADLIAVDFAEPRVRPVYDVASALVYASKSSDVSLTVVDGKILWDGRKWRSLDANAVVKAAADWREKIQKSLKEPKTSP